MQVVKSKYGRWSWDFVVSSTVGYELDADVLRLFKLVRGDWKYVREHEGWSLGKTFGYAWALARANWRMLIPFKVIKFNPSEESSV